MKMKITTVRCQECGWEKECSTLPEEPFQIEHIRCSNCAYRQATGDVRQVVSEIRDVDVLGSYLEQEYGPTLKAYGFKTMPAPPKEEEPPKISKEEEDKQLTESGKRALDMYLNRTYL